MFFYQGVKKQNKDDGKEVTVKAARGEGAPSRDDRLFELLEKTLRNHFTQMGNLQVIVGNQDTQMGSLQVIVGNQETQIGNQQEQIALQREEFRLHKNDTGRPFDEQGVWNQNVSNRLTRVENKGVQNASELTQMKNALPSTIRKEVEGTIRKEVEGTIRTEVRKEIRKELKDIMNEQNGVSGTNGSDFSSNESGEEGTREMKSLLSYRIFEQI